MSDRERSFWGWGDANKFPDTDTRRQMGQVVGAMLGVEGPVPRPAPQLDQIRMPSPRVSPPAHLAEICTDDRRARALHTYGRSYVDIARGFSGDFSPAPDFVATPRTEAQVAALLEWGGAERVALIPFGGGTSVVRGIEADLPEGFSGAASVDMGRMDKVLSVDRISSTARIQAGATGPALEAQLAEHGLTLRHFPQSFEFSTLGGWVATRAGGHFATLYTHIDDLVASIRAVSPAGVVQTLTLPGSGAGPDPDRLMLGSEGTLGIITEAVVRVRPRPTWRARVSVRFADWDKAVGAVRDISQSGLFPANCRLLDAREAQLHSVSFDGSHVLLLGFESSGQPRDAWLSQALELCAAREGEPASTPTVIDGDSAEGGRGGDQSSAWRSAFIDAPYLVNTMVSLGVVVDTFETACTWSAFEALHEDVVRSVRAAMKASCGRGRVSCRFTHVYPDGPAPYYTFLAPGRPGEEIEQWTQIKAAASEALLRHGATITHHHAVGRLHKPWYLRQTPPLFIDALKAVKARLDPEGILNPGALFD